ncbi:C-type cyclin [Phlyctema vagabunda]|uniref:RNA polymerase II holoenzyme cyclin-like subunit n=1 Tax=Phlyctema vagabunda TaxID=108571 RepID=A0ABR4PVZ9_9HELO
MGPTATSNGQPVPTEQPGPHPSYLQVAKPYLFQQQLQSQLAAISATQTREDSFRLQGVQWIDDVRTGLQLPVRTFDTAVSCFHRFRLIHKDIEYQYQDAAAASLLTACKIEDTLKKSREILCAAHNLKVPIAEHLSSDDNVFDGPSKIVIGLERLMLEAANFDFRSRYPQKQLIKLTRKLQLDKNITDMAYKVMLDSYRTFTPLKQTSGTMSWACIELSLLILGAEQTDAYVSGALRYKDWHTSRGEILETIFDLLDLYTHFQKATTIGPLYTIESFIAIRIKLNQEMEEKKGTSRFTEMLESTKTNGHKAGKTPKTPKTPASPSDARASAKEVVSPATLSPRSAGSGRRGMGVRGQEGTVRFMLDAEEAKKEKEIAAAFFKVEYEDYEIEVEEPIRPEKHERERPPPRDYRNGGGRYDKYDNHYMGNKRVRR